MPRLPKYLRDQLSLLPCTSMLWIVVIVIFAFADWRDASRFAQAGHGYLDYLAVWARGMAPWLLVFPTVYRLGQSASSASSTTKLRTALVCGLTCLTGLMSYAVLLSFFLTERSLFTILASVRLLDWFWDTAFFVMTFGAGLQTGRTVAETPTINPRAVVEVRSPQRIEYIPVNEILGASAQGNYIALHLQARDVLHRATLKQLLDQLAPHGFVQCHRSHLFHTDSVRSIKRHARRVSEVELLNGSRLPVSARFNDSVRTRLDTVFPTAPSRPSQEPLHSTQMH